MIRRRVGDEFWLITQNDHARLAGEFARHFGNAAFERPVSLEQTLTAITHHDSGWPAQDCQLLLNAAGLPLDVFEAPRRIAHQAWLQSARSATAVDPYVGLLVTLHQFHLSAQSVPQTTPQALPRAFEVEQLREQFEMNKFQHAVIEHIETLRRRLGLATDRTLRLGLADGWTTPAEDELRFNFRLLQTMDGLSLAACCTRRPRSRIGPLHASAGSPEIYLNVERNESGNLTVSPWPFDQLEISFDVAYRPVPARTFTDPSELEADWNAAVPGKLSITLTAG